MTQHNMQFDTSDVILYVLAFFLPPFPILIRVGFCTNQFLLNVLLTLLFGLPGTLHALYIIYITSPITGSPDRRVINGDYERVIENDGTTPNNDNYPQAVFDQQADNAQEIPSSSSIHQPVNAPPPPYEDSKDFNKDSTDNKVQKF